MSRADRSYLASSPSEWKFACRPPPLVRCVTLLKRKHFYWHDRRQEYQKNGNLHLFVKERTVCTVDKYKSNFLATVIKQKVS